MTAQKYGLEDITYSSFELHYGYKNKFCAADTFSAVYTALTDPSQVSTRESGLLRNEEP